MEIVESQLDDYKSKGLVKSKEDQKVYRKRLEAIADENMKNFNSRTTLLSKGYRKKQRKGIKAEKEIPIEGEQQVGKGHKKKNSVERFWETIDKL